MPKTQRKSSKNTVTVRGFFRVHLVEHDDDGIPRIVGDSGWQENQVVMLGKAQYLALALASNAGSKYVGRMAIGSGTAPGSNDTSLQGEFAQMTGASSTRNRISVLTSTGSTGAIVTVQFAGTWGSNTQFVTVTNNTLANIALCEGTLNAGGTIFAGNTFASSPLNTNQDVQASYIVSFT